MALAIANRYATALDDVLERTGQSSSSDDALTHLRGFADLLATSAELRNVFASPAVTGADKRSLIESIGQKLNIGKPVRNLLYLLSDRRRMSLTGDVAAAFEARLDERRGIVRAAVTSAAPLGAEERKTLLEKFERLTGKRAEAEYAVDESLLGGAIVQVSGQVFDGSVATQLRALGRMMAGGR